MFSNFYSVFESCADIALTVADKTLIASLVSMKQVHFKTMRLGTVSIVIKSLACTVYKTFLNIDGQ